MMQIICPFHAITGLYCPFCGATRAMQYLYHGKLALALNDNALVVLSIPIFLFLLIRPKKTHHRLTVWILGFAIASIVFMIVRNISWSPCTYLVPFVSGDEVKQRITYVKARPI